MKEISVEEFVRRMRRLLDRDAMLAFFLGAGASISSGIAGAGALADGWARELHATEVAADLDFEQWRQEKCESFNPKNPAASYSAVMRRLFPSQAERQQEIERVVRGHDPGFAYATLAQLLADPRYGPRCNVVLTTNFDDLVADALYLFTRTRPLVVTHQALVNYAAVGRSRPTVIKLHGDAMLQPRNTEDEIASLDQAFKAALQSHLRSRALVMIGYGGNDAGVCEALSSLPVETITHGVYWVNAGLPDSALGDWLRGHPESVFVNHLDFDELMAVVKTEFDLPNPDRKRFDDLLDRYRKTFSNLQAKVREAGDDTSVVARSVEEVRKKFDNWFSVELEAQKYNNTDPDRAADVYEAGITQFPDSAPLLGVYAGFLTEIRHDDSRAEEFYERAILADPNDAVNLHNFAVFLKNVRKDFDRAEKLYERAIGVEATEATLGVYANFLWTVRHNYDRAEQVYEQAIAADPDHFFNLGNYAGFLYSRGRPERAQAMLDRLRAVGDLGAEENAQFRVEVGFYELANGRLTQEQRRATVDTVRRTLATGARSPGWSFATNIDRARVDGASEAELEFLVALAAVINDEAPLESLERFEEWPSG